MKRFAFNRLLAAALLAACLATPRAPASEPETAALVPMAEGILAAYAHADLVCLGERHGREMDSKLRIQLVRHPEFARKVDVIIVEFANSVHQDLLDRWIGGEDIPMEQIRWVWRDTHARAWDSPIYEEFLVAIREVNRQLPKNERLRVLAGDIPLDWSRIHTWKDMPAFINRGSFPVGVIDREILSKGLKGLAIYGAGHCERWDIAFTPALEEKYPGRIWVSAPLEPDAHQRLKSALQLGAQPRLILVQNSAVAAHPAVEYLWDPRFPRPQKLAEVVDALAYFGDLPDPVVEVDPKLYEEGEYARELKRRDRIYLDWANEQRKRYGNREP